MSRKAKVTLNGEPDLIYHYTTVSGLKGIIENKKIWATNINYLNDWKEFREFVDPFLSRFKGSGIEKHIGEIFDKHSRTIYVCSFSSKADDLSQWRGYSPSASGFSIGFSYSKLKRMLPPGELFSLYQCKYDAKDKKDEINNVVKRNVKSDRPDIHDLTKIITELTARAPCYKNEKFKAEDEWRLVNFVKDEPIKFREGKTILIPYIEIDLTKEGCDFPIESICIGPTPYITQSALSIKMLLEYNGLSNVKIIKSNVPYRTL